MITSNELETTVVANMQRLFDAYCQMDQQVDAMLAAQARGESIQDLLSRLKHGREKIVAIETDAAPAARQYRESFEKSSNEVNALTKQTKQLIERMMIKIGKLEQSARDACQLLAPEIDRSVRVHQMKQAYRSQ